MPKEEIEIRIARLRARLGRINTAIYEELAAGRVTMYRLWAMEAAAAELDRRVRNEQ